jgi:hypothetical protein
VDLAGSLRRNQRGESALRAYVLLLALVLGNCSASEIIQNWTHAPTPDLSQPDYRRIIAAAIDKILPGRLPIDELEISDIRLVERIKGPAWLICLKVDPRGNPRHLAIFIQDNKIVDWRSGLVIDQCHKASYVPFLLPVQADKPAN